MALAPQGQCYPGFKAIWCERLSARLPQGSCIFPTGRGTRWELVNYGTMHIMAALPPSQATSAPLYLCASDSVLLTALSAMCAAQGLAALGGATQPARQQHQVIPVGLAAEL